MRTQGPGRIARGLSVAGAAVVVLLLFAPSAAPAAACGLDWATEAVVGRPAEATAWRAVLSGRTRLWRSVPTAGDESDATIGPEAAGALLVTRAARDVEGRCWLLVALPSRPNDARAWLRADRVALRPTPWRLVVSRRARTLTVLRADVVRRRFHAVVGAPATPTPDGLFSIIGVWRWNAADFLGSYILPLTAHSDVLQEFGGGDGRVGIHGRGGASLLDPLGSDRSHGCIRLSNRAIGWIVRRVGPHRLPGIPVKIR